METMRAHRRCGAVSRPCCENPTHIRPANHCLGLPRVQTEGEKVRRHFPEVPRVGFVDYVACGWVEFDRKGVRAKQLVLDALQDVPTDALASVVAFDLQVSNPTDGRFRFRYLRVEFGAPIGCCKTTLFKSVGDSTFGQGHAQIR